MGSIVKGMSPSWLSGGEQLEQLRVVRVKERDVAVDPPVIPEGLVAFLKERKARRDRESTPLTLEQARARYRAGLKVLPHSFSAASAGANDTIIAKRGSSGSSGSGSGSGSGSSGSSANSRGGSDSSDSEEDGDSSPEGEDDDEGDDDDESEASNTDTSNEGDENNPPAVAAVVATVATPSSLEEPAPSFRSASAAPSVTEDITLATPSGGDASAVSASAGAVQGAYSSTPSVAVARGGANAVARTGSGGEEATGKSAQPAALIGDAADAGDAPAANNELQVTSVSAGALQPSVLDRGDPVTAGGGKGGGEDAGVARGAGVSIHAEEPPSKTASSAFTTTTSIPEVAKTSRSADNMETGEQQLSGGKFLSSSLPTSGQSPIKAEREQEVAALTEFTPLADDGTVNAELVGERAETADPEVPAAGGGSGMPVTTSAMETMLSGLAGESSKVKPSTCGAIPSMTSMAKEQSVTSAALESATGGLRPMDVDVSTNALRGGGAGAGASNVTAAAVIAAKSPYLTPAADADRGSATTGADKKRASSSTIDTAQVVERKSATKDVDGTGAKVHGAETHRVPPPAAEARSAGPASQNEGADATTTKQASKKSGRRSAGKEEKPPSCGPDVFPPALECVIDMGLQETGRATTDTDEQCYVAGHGHGNGTGGAGGSTIDRLYGDHCLEREAAARAFFDEHDTLRRRFQMAVDLVELDKAVESEGLELRNGCRTVQTIKMRLKSRWREGTVLGTGLGDSAASGGGYGRSGGKGGGLSCCTSKEVQQATLRWQEQIKAVICDHKELLAEVLGRQRLEAGALQMAQEMEVPKGKAPPLIVRFAFPRMFEEVAQRHKIKL
ncbi:unnamed protein product [Pylaiella littoralis]